ISNLLEFLPIFILGFLINTFSLVNLLVIFLSVVLFMVFFFVFLNFTYLSIITFLLYVSGIVVLISYFVSLQPNIHVNNNNLINLFFLGLLVPLFNNNNFNYYSSSWKLNQFLFLNNGEGVVFLVIYFSLCLFIVGFLVSFCLGSNRN
uniref:NADH dehydrogenase subunit 6 n=1 Tax=Miroplana shenzhensis TaxID=2597322 RepID=UPI001FAF5EA8